MFNPAPRLQRWPLWGEHAAWVVDGALQNPQALVTEAARQQHRFEMAPYNAYPGVEWRPGAVMDGPLNEFFMQHLRARLGARRTLDMYSRLSMVTLSPSALGPLQRLCHRDRFAVVDGECALACTLYLFEDPSLGGTSFFRPRQDLDSTNALIRHWHSLNTPAFEEQTGVGAAYLTNSNSWFELMQVIPAAFNRAVFYDGSLFHTSHILAPDRLSTNPMRGRLTLNGFFVCRRAAA